jgi:hypothetical protein
MSQDSTVDYYEVLQVNQNVTWRRFTAYIAFLRALSSDNSGVEMRRVPRILAAYTVISDPEQRAA